MNKIIDIHCHLADLIEVNDNSNSLFSTNILYVSTARNEEEIRKHLEYKLPYWFAGIHPWDYKLVSTDKTKILESIPYDRVLGIGEIGLDRNSGNIDQQLQLLRQELHISCDNNLPSLYHLVGREYDFIQEIKKVKLAKMKIIHGFNSSLEVFRELKKLGFYFSIGSRLLANPKRRPVLTEIIKSEKYFLESDASAVQDLNKVKIIAEMLEKDYNVTRKKVMEVVVRNFSNLIEERGEFISKI